MANLHNEFGVFHDRIALTQGRMAALKHVREDIRDRISQYFLNTLGVLLPEFRGQGSYAMETSTDPLVGEHAIDDGVYLQHLDRRNCSGWPAPEIVHLWVADAARGHTEASPIDKQACVRVACAGQYHMDLRIYAELNGKSYLAECSSRGWHRNDPLALTNWFSGAVRTHGEQLRRIARYLKAWADFQSQRRGKMPSGLILTVYAVRNFVPDDRDDIALALTFRSMESDIDALVYILNPVDLNEELTVRLTDARKKRFQEAIQDAAIGTNAAVVIEACHKASRLWRKQLGDRFPLIQE